MDKMIDTLDIELQGIRAKLSAIQEYKSGKNVSIEGLAKLEEILTEQTIELAGTLARKEAVLGIRKREEEFYNLFRQWQDNVGKSRELGDYLEKCERDMRRFQEMIDNPTPEMLPPKVNGNKVVINPVVIRN
jgi:hypothetical protein